MVSDRRSYTTEQKQMTTEYVWIWIAGVLLLGLALAYGIFRNRTRTSRERAVTEAATKERYRQEDRSN
jgi:cytochrome c-type biogenesis protein CcmH/NrfF